MPDARHEELQLGGISVGATARRAPGRSLRSSTKWNAYRTLRYTYSRAAPNRIVVDVQFVDHGKAGDHATRAYETAASAEGASTSTTPSNGTRPGAVPAAGAPKSAAASDSSEHAASGTFAQEPGAELKGVKSIGLVVDASGPQAVACGLNQEGLETALSKRLTAAGLNVRLNADEDTYVYINVRPRATRQTICASLDTTCFFTPTRPRRFRIIPRRCSCRSPCSTRADWRAAPPPLTRTPCSEDWNNTSIYS